MTTYSTNLRLNMIGSGAEAGTWGNTTNYNLGTLVEEAVAGYAVISVAVADYPLTANNGVEDESRMAMLRINTSVIAATFRVYAPPVSKTYVIWNTSAYDMWLYNSTVIGNTTGAGLYAVIKAGDKSMVFSDGTNFYLLSTSSASVSSVNASGGTTGMTFSGGPITSSGTLTMAGTLAIANGGTGITSFGTGVQTALGQNVTGSGGIVLASAPSIANAALTGVPTAPTAAPGTNTTQVATTAFVAASTSAGVAGAYPVGSIYMNASNATNPATLLGFGTWTALAPGRVLLGAGTGGGGTYTAGATGGNKDATLVYHSHYINAVSTSAAGSHYHGIGNNNGANGGTFGYGSWSGVHFPGANSWNWNGSGGGIGYGGDITSGNMVATYSINGAGGDTHTHTTTGYTDGSGSSSTDANLQPYLVVYMWQRTA